MASAQNQRDQKPSINKEDDYAMLLSPSQVIPMVLNASIELNLFDIIASRANRDGYMSPSEISSQQFPQKTLVARLFCSIACYVYLQATHFLLSLCAPAKMEGLRDSMDSHRPANSTFEMNVVPTWVPSHYLIFTKRKQTSGMYIYANY